MSKSPVAPRSSRVLLTLLAATTLVWSGCTDLGDRAPTAPETPEQTLERPSNAELSIQDFGPARAVARQHTPALMAIHGVVGTGVGLNEAGRPAVKVFLAHDRVVGIPDRVNGVPVASVVTGPFVARADRTSRARPAPIGFSVGHPDITAGTLGARVTDGTNIYILSNNHVIANSNNANLGDPTLQPGPVDGGNEPGDVIGTLHAYEEILFNGPDNVMDAAVSLVDGADVSGSTPADEGYGAPGTVVTDASLGLAVQKYGRTTGHTLGDVAEIDVTVSVCYAGVIFCTSVATFVNQFTITPGSFSAGGDSGSLIVTDGSGNNPVGLLFAGSDTRTIANPIGPVLERFGVEIDPTVPGGGGDPNNPPTASFTANCTDLECSFDGSGSSDSDGSIVSWDWTFGDGNNASGETVSHTYGAGGTYAVSLTVTDDDGATDTAFENVTVSGPGGGDADPVIGTFNVSTRTTGPWRRADVAWTVSDADGDLATVTTELLNGSGNVLDSVTSSVSGSSASGNHSLRTRSGTPTAVRITVTDGNGNQASQQVSY